MALASGRAIYGQAFNPQIALKSPTYFEDRTVRNLPNALRKRLVRAVQAVDLDHLPVIRATERGVNRHPGSAP